MRRSLIAFASVGVAVAAWFAVADRAAEVETIRLRPDSPDVVAQGQSSTPQPAPAVTGPIWRASRTGDRAIPTGGYQPRRTMNAATHGTMTRLPCSS